MHDYANEQQVVKEKKKWTQDYAKEVAMRKIPVLDDLGRAHAVGEETDLRDTCDAKSVTHWPN